METTEDKKVTCFGRVNGSHLWQLVRQEHDSYEDFVKKCLNELTYCRHPFYAYVKAFEEECLGIRVEKELQHSPYEAKRFAIQVLHLPDCFKGVGAECMYAWDKYVETKNEFYLSQIVAHNRACLIQELMLVLV